MRAMNSSDTTKESRALLDVAIEPASARASAAPSSLTDPRLRQVDRGRADMKYVASVCIALLGCTTHAGAWVDPLANTPALISACRLLTKPEAQFTRDDLTSALICKAYAYGFISGHNLDAAFHGGSAKICFPGGLTPQQIATVYVQ